MPGNNPLTLWSALAGGDSSARLSVGDGDSATWGELRAGSVLEVPAVELRGCSVLLATVDQFAAAAALIELDGVARRIVLCPSDFPREHIAYVANAAEADAIVSDVPVLGSRDVRVVGCVRKLMRRDIERGAPIETEWILLTSGTTGLPKLVRHTLASLSGAIEPRVTAAGAGSSSAVVWSTFYDIRRYGGLQIFLRAALNGTSLVLAGANESTADFLTRAGMLGVTHMSGTPSHWRRALMSPAAGRIAPGYVRLSGEIADQALLNQLRSQYPQARIAHAFASTEAGVVFEVNDGLMGVPVETIGSAAGVAMRGEMKVEGGTLRVRSERTAAGYLGPDSPTLKDADDFVDTGDSLELRDGRYYFVGRQDGTINVGGLKVHPEEVEAVINRHPEVSVSLVKTKKNPITGSLVVADVVLKMPGQSEGVQGVMQEILQVCRGELAVHKVPVAINFVTALPMGESGKVIRRA